MSAPAGNTISWTKKLAYAQRRLDLSAELENAKNELPGQVLRETTANILRHAQAEQVRITLSQWGIGAINYGAQEAPLPALRGLADLRGLATLRERVMANGGELTVEQKDGRFLTAPTFPRRRSEAQENR